jgi:uncharacterized protein YbjT (DUF2867 family)
MASKHDADVERAAIRDANRHIRDMEDEKLWRRAAQDSDFVAEMQQLADGFMAYEKFAWQL